MKNVEYRSLIAFAFLFFIIKSIYFIFNTDLGLPPDEIFHFKFAQFISDYGFPIPESTATYCYGSLNTRPYLYHYLMSFVFNLNTDEQIKVLLLRSINLLLFLISCVMFFLCLRKITDKKITKVLSIYIYTNLLMLTFLSSSITYDISIIVISVCIFYNFITFFQTSNLIYIYWIFLFGLIGTLIKLTIIPYLIIVLLVSLFLSYKYRNKLNLKLNGTFKVSTPLFLFLFYLNFSLFLGNIINYGKINPTSVDVLGEEICLSHIENYKIYKNFRDTRKSRERLHFTEYFSSHINQTIKTTYGILAHFKYNNKLHKLSYTYIFIIILTLLFINKKKKPLFHMSSIFFLFYYLFLMVYNYISYSNTHV